MVTKTILNNTDWDEGNITVQDVAMSSRLLFFTKDVGACKEKQMYITVTYDSGDSLPDESQTKDLTFVASSVY